MSKETGSNAFPTADAVLFDLDGTLVDTAPDMVPILQQMQSEYGVTPVDYETGRSFVSNGSHGLITLGFGDLEESRRRELQEEYLRRYAQQVNKHSGVFDGLDPLLLTMEAKGAPWGVVTNKPKKLTDALMRELALDTRSSVTVSGDTLPQRKPDPAPLLHACGIAGIDPKRTLFVGDALRDIDAGRRAGMTTVAAGYGYIVAGDDPVQWGADYLVGSVTELCQLLSKAFSL